MKKALLCLFLSIGGISLFSQTITLDTEENCFSTEPLTLTSLGDDGQGHNVFEGMDGANTITIAFNYTLNRWEILFSDTPNPGEDPVYIVMLYSTVASAPNPPDHTTGNYVATGSPLTCNLSLLTITGCNPEITSIDLNQTSYCTGDAVILTINGDLGGAAEWVVYNDNGCGITEVIRSASNNINIGSRADYGSYTVYVRGEGGCVSTPGDCFSKTFDVESDVNISCSTIGPAAVNANCFTVVSDYTSAPYVNVTDDCADTYSVTQYPPVGTQLGPGVYPITMTVVNEAGASDACTITLTVTDAIAPSATSPLTTINVDCVDDVPDPNPGLVADAMDNCEDCPETVWVNEFHYDNAGVDVNEFVEVAGTAGTDLSAYSLVFYNGGDGMVYSTVPLSGTIDDESNGFGAIGFPLVGIQDEEPDGFALVKDGTQVLEFWSYDGLFVATDGPAAGMQSTDVGSSEIASATGNSLQRTGTGNIGPDFVWVGPVTASSGDLNTDQTLAVCGGLTVTHDGDVNNGATGDNGDPYIVTRTYRVTDAGGLSFLVTQEIRAEDTEMPEINCVTGPLAIVYRNDMCQTNVGNAQASVVLSVDDNCTDPGDLTIVQSPSVGTIIDILPGETFMLTYTVSDEAGNSNSCMVNVEAVDDTPPVIEAGCPGDQNPPVDGCFFELPDYTSGLTLSDNCTASGDLTVVQNPPAGTMISSDTEVSITVTDALGGYDQQGLSTNCTFTVFYDGGSPPTNVQCPGPIAVNNDPGQCNAAVTVPDPTWDDGCGTVTISNDYNSSANASGTYPVGITTVKYTVEDEKGDGGDCTVMVTVTDNEKPTLTCQDVSIQLDETGQFDIDNIDFLLNNVITGRDDNCGVMDDFPITGSTTFSCEQVGLENIRGVAVKDVHDNVSDYCEFKVTVLGIVAIDEVIVTDESCEGAGDGRLEIIATGLNALEYSIDGGNSFQDFPEFYGLPDGEYDIVVQDKAYPTCEDTESATIEAGPVCELTAADPCSCLNNASPYDMDADTGGGDGQFSEVVTIAADQPLPAGLIFRVISPTTGVYDAYNVPAEGNQSAGVPVATDGSVTFTYNNGVYELPFVHNDGEGYNMTVILEVEGVNAIGFQLSNTCFYPEPEITSILDGPFCSLSLPITLEGNAGGVAGTGTFYIDGTEITVFDPAAYVPGTYTISYVFDAGEALGYQLENNLVVGPPDGAETLAEAKNDPGCIATVIKSIEIIPKPEGYACREQVNVNLQENCQATLKPENLVGDLDCVDLSGYFEINVEDDDQSNGAVVDGCGTYKYTVIGPDGLDCWGFVTAEDKQAPTLLYCPEPIAGIDKNYGYQAFLCEDLSKLLIPTPITYTSDKDGNIDFEDIPSGVRDILDITGYAEFVDNCGQLTITVSDEVIYGFDPNCDDVKIIRRFTAVDACKGLAAGEICTQEITFTKPGLEDVHCPKDAELACDDEFLLDANGNPHPDETGYPWVYTAFDLTDDDEENYRSYLDQNFCNLGASYTDGERIEVCEGTYKIVRTWEILDWCVEGYERVWECSQIIKVGDEEPPTVTCPEVDYNNDGIADLRSYSTGPYDCTAAFSVPMPEVSDNCSEWEVLTEIVSSSEDGPVVAIIPPGQSRYVSNLPLGCYFIRYTVTDACGQKTVVHCPFVVEDRVEPVAVCDDDLNVSIGGQGLARVAASEIDEGSSDNCGPIRIEVRRRILNIDAYECLDMFDYNDNGEVIGDEIKESVQFGDPDGDGVGQMFYYTPWEEYVDFTCCDMNQSVRVELRVWDDRNEDGIAGNEIERTYCGAETRDVKDNFNVCWMDLLIEDKLPAYCVPPLPAEIDCDALPFDFDPTNVEQMTELFGAASGTDNCPGYTVAEVAPLTDGLNDCGYGYFVRRFEVTDAKGLTSTNTCEQIVTVKEQHHYKIKFPKDAEANCGIPAVDSVEVEELACDLLAVSVKDDFFSASGDECYKIFRTYSVINWCEYDGISDPVVVSRDEDCDGKPGDEDIWVIVETVDDPDPCYDYYGTDQADYYSHVWYDRDNDPFNLIPAAETKGENCDYETNPAGFWKEVVPITDNDEDDGYPENNYGDHCEDMASVGYWQYTQVIKVYDNVNPVVEFTAPDPFCTYSSDVENGCPAEVSIDFTIDENCTPDDLTITVYLDAGADGTLDEEITDLLTGIYPNYNVTGSFPIGTHQLGIEVEDGCGNSIGINIPFEVTDCKAPTPVCINGLAIELMPVIPAADADGDGDLDKGAMAIWASDFVASPVPDCSGEVTYSINRVGEEVDQDQTGITLTCDDDASLLIEVWAWDELGNGDFCETYVLVQDNMVNCEEGSASGSIAGIIADEDLNTLAGVDVALSGSAFQNMLTPNDGHYLFADLANGFDYTVTPQLEGAPLNGVSTFDLVLMSKHILGTQLLDSPYKRIAADVNNSKTITTLDAIQLRRLVLNIDLKFSNNTSWRFVPRNYRFPDPSAPWSPAFPEVININDLQGALNQEDFVGIKIGDLNLSAVPNALVSEARNIAGQFLFNVEDQELKAGETYRVDFRAADLALIQGYQMTLQLDPEIASVRDIQYGIAQAVNFGTRAIREGLITASWNMPVDGSANYRPNDLIFSLEINVRQEIKLSELLKISNRITVAEAYDQDDQLLDVGIDFGSGTIETAGFELFQNVPNPFREVTAIGFYLPENSAVSLRIHDISGRSIKLIRGEFARGFNQINLSRAELGASGMLYYTLTAGEHMASRKMLVIE